MRLDKDLQADVMRELEWEPSVESAGIGVAAKEGAIILSGHVGSYAEKVAADKAARRVYGVRAVADELVVELPRHNLHDDTDIAETIARLLEWSVTVPKGAVTAKVSKGIVTLEGKVDWEYQLEAASKLVRGLAGVKAVINLVAVRPKAHDKEIKSKITEALHRQAQLDARRIWLETSDGKIILHGQVSSWSEAETARKAAAAAPGVTKVESRLAIVP
jgi:osmotically-inducible protein OsmY